MLCTGDQGETVRRSKWRGNQGKIAGTTLPAMVNNVWFYSKHLRKSLWVFLKFFFVSTFCCDFRGTLFFAYGNFSLASILLHT